MRNVRDQADVVLYLVNAAEEPADAGYLAPELDGARVDRQAGDRAAQPDRAAARPRRREPADEARWRDALARGPVVRDVLTLDAFARCWVQECALFAAIAPRRCRRRSARCSRASIDGWTRRRMAQFDAAMAALAGPIARAAGDRVRAAGRPAAAPSCGRSLGIARPGGETPEDEPCGR